MSAFPVDTRLIVFDLGKVLLDFDYRIAAQHLSQHTHFKPEHIIELLLDTPLLLDYEKGAMTSTGFYHTIVRKTGLRIAFADFTRLFGDIFSPIDPMLEVLEQVQARGFSTAVLSNTNELAIQFIRANFPFFATFSHQILSYEHHAMKPDPALYRVVESASGVPPARILFIDDRPENVEAARKLGWQAFVHHDPQDTRQTFARFGLLNSE